MTENTRKTAALTGLFGSFMFLQLTVLNLDNHAGEGLLPAQQREQVYYLLQVPVIAGFFIHAAAARLLQSSRVRRGFVLCAATLFFAGSAGMLAAPSASAVYLAASCLTMLCLGYLGGAVYLRMSCETSAGAKTARSMGFGCAAAAGLQYVLQLAWGATALLSAAMLAAFGLLCFLLLRAAPPALPRTAEQTRAKPRRLAFAVLIAAAFLLFTAFYNGYINRLQMHSGYTAYNVYTWPRLMWIPAYLLFAVIGELRQGRLVPMAALCVTLAAMLNSVLTSRAGAYWLNMCLFYCAIAACVSYYNLTFWRLAQGTGRPALWASFGRVLDSGVVLLTGAIRISELSAPVVLAVDLAGLAVIILLMAVGGDFELSATRGKAPQTDPLTTLQARFGLTPTECRVLRELVLTEDKQTAIADRLSIKVRTVQANVTALYRKTGVSTRAGLVQLYRDAQ